VVVVVRVVVVVVVVIVRVLVLQILALTLLHIHTLPGGPLPLLCSRAHAGVVLPHTPRALPTQTLTLSYGIAMGVYSLSLPLSL